MNEKNTHKPLIRKLQSRKQLQKLMRRYYLFARYAHLFGKKIAYVTSGAPVEILYALGYVPVYPENHSAIIGASKKGREYCETAEGYGYSQDLCSYTRCDLTTAFTGKTPVGKLPPPDILIACNNICGTVIKWYEILQQYFNVPLVVIDTPFIHDTAREHTVEYVHRQLEELVEIASAVSGRRFSENRLTRTLHLSLEGIHLWKSILKLCENRPSPITCFDAFIHIAPVVTMRGTKALVRYYKILLKEISRRVEEGNGAIPEERLRLIWDNIPIWYELRHLGEFFARRGAALVADTYTTAWTLDLINPDRGLRSLAEAYLPIYLNLGLTKKYDKIRELVSRYDADGVVMHSNRSCKAYSFGQLDIQRKLGDEAGVPSVLIEADMTDQRAYARAQVENRLQSFLEMIDI